MSGILDRIVRRRRATASSRLGPPPGTEPFVAGSVPHVNGTATPNGGPPAYAELNGHPPVEEAEEQAAAAEAEAALEVAASELGSEPNPEPDPEPIHKPDPDPEPVTKADPDPGPQLAPEDRPAPIVREPQAAVEPALVEPTPGPSAVPETPGFLQRGRVRRRARYLRRLREIQLRDIGGFMVELTRFQQERPDIVRAKVEGALRTHEELRTLERALGSEQPLRELREPGIGGVCLKCGALYGSGDRYCSSCGEPLGRKSDRTDTGA